MGGTIGTMTDNDHDNDQYEHFIVERWDQPAVEFDGVLLAERSSRTDNEPRWQEVRIYRTSTGKYVTEVVGRSTVEGESDILNVRIYRKAEKVRLGLYRRHGGREFLTDTAFEALEEAAQKDPGIVVLDTERI